MNSIELDYFCRDHRGRPSPPNQANIYFVMLNGDCVLATTIFNVANNLFDAWVNGQIKQSAVLADRRIGDLANYYPTTGVSLDVRNFDYYQAQKYGVTEQYVKEHREKCEVHRVDKPNQWLVKHGKRVDTYFYVQHVQRNGKLRGFVLYFSRAKHQGEKFVPAKYQGEAIFQTIEKEDIHDWKVADSQVVRALKLETYK